ncbi:MAG: vitamin B12 dependent-methionine synthase activation domain-containing protein [Calditrichia bacterium]
MNKIDLIEIEDINDVFSFQLEMRDLDLPLKSLGRAMGYPGVEHIPPLYVGKIKDVLNQANQLVHIEAGFRIIPENLFQLRNEGIRCGKVELHTGKIIARQLKGSSTVAVFVATAGPVFDRWSREMFESGDFPAGYVVDCVGSEIAEGSADWLEKKLEDILAPRGLNRTNRFSPGYCGWDVREQQKLFSLLPGNFCGVKLTHSSLMVPIKSVSGIIGIGASVKKQDYPCALCDRKDCYKRRTVED